MRNYQRKKINEYSMPHNLYMQIQYKIRDYDRLKREYLDILHSSPDPHEIYSKAAFKGSPTESKAIKLSCIDNSLKGIDQAIIEVRGIYSSITYEEFDPIKAYWSYDYYNYIHKRKNMDDIGPSRRTWNNYKTMFSKIIAQNLKLF